MDKLEEICRVLPCQIRRLLKAADIDIAMLQEIRLRVCRPLIIRYNSREYYISQKGEICRKVECSYVAAQSDVKETFELLSEFSTYAYEEELRQGYITIAGGHRIGIAGKAVVEKGKIKNIRNISFINIRVANERPGCADAVMPFLFEKDMLLHTMIISPPGAGKTTLLRDIVRQISDGSEKIRGRNVGVVDERSEICACYRGIPQNDVGIRTDVLDACPKDEGMMRLVRSMSPEVIAVDEIGTAEDFRAVEYVLRSGCAVITTVHGSGIEDICKNIFLSEAVSNKYFQRYIILDGNMVAGRVAKITDENGAVICDRNEAYRGIDDCCICGSNRLHGRGEGEKTAEAS